MMFKMEPNNRKALDIYYRHGHEKAWAYWKLLGNTYGIFLGEVLSSDFIDGTTLAKHVGVYHEKEVHKQSKLFDLPLIGKLFFGKSVTRSTEYKGVHDVTWLKFILDGNIIYVPKTPVILAGVYWADLYECGAVFENGGSTIEINGSMYDVTLLKGLDDANLDPVKNYSGYAVQGTQNSEWNRLFYPIHAGPHSIAKKFNNGKIPFSVWENYTDDDLLLHNEYSGDAKPNMIQETKTESDGIKIALARGFMGVTCTLESGSDSLYNNWRPALRLL